MQFYGWVFLVASGSCLIRTFRDNEFARTRAILGRCLSSGIFAFGGIAIWLGRYPLAADSSGVPFLAVAAFIGLLDKELQTKAVEWVVSWLFSKMGANPPDGNK